MKTFRKPLQDIEEDGGLPKIEAQIWIAIYNLLSKKVCTDKYEINSYRKNVIVKMAEKISDDYIDQLPMLKPFKKWLLQLSISNPPSSSTHMKANFMIETVAELREGLIRRYYIVIQVVSILFNFEAPTLKNLII